MSRCVVVRKEDIETALKTASKPGKHLLDSFRAFAEKGFPFSVIENKEVLVTQSELHTKEGDLVFCFEGEVQFVYGGELLDPAPLKLQDGSIDETNILGQGIRGGEKVVLKAGDWLWIPPNEAHMHTGTARIAMIKIPFLS